MIRISNIKCPVNGDIKSTVQNIVGENVRFTIHRKSVDARKKNDVHFVYTIDAECENESALLKKIKGASIVSEKKYVFPKGKKIQSPIVIVGCGPSGLMCGLMLARSGCKVIIVERGKCVEERQKDVAAFWGGSKLNPDSNIQFGEGGAGTFSDGKLNTGIKDLRIRTVLEEFHRHGAPEEILYLAKPHVGTDNLYKMVRSIRREIISLGGEVRFNSRLDGIIVRDSKICGAKITANGDTEYTIDTSHIVLATGHSARDTFVMLKNSGVNMERKSFSVGVRIEHSQEMINKSQYGDFYKSLPSADYKLAVHLKNGRGVYTFCMCPGGEVAAAASEIGGVVTNGMSNFARDGKNANSAVLVNVTPDDFDGDDVLGGMYFQREIEQRAFELSGSYKAPAQRLRDFLNRDTKFGDVVPTYKPDVEWCDISKIFPNFITEALKDGIIEMDKKLNGFADGGAVITAPETRSSSPIRILRDTKFESNIKGLYPCGEGAGYAGGITSAAVDGIKTAEAIVLG